MAEIGNGTNGLKTFGAATAVLAVIGGVYAVVRPMQTSIADLKERVIVIEKRTEDIGHPPPETFRVIDDVRKDIDQMDSRLQLELRKLDEKLQIEIGNVRDMLDERKEVWRRDVDHVKEIMNERMPRKGAIP